MPENIWSPLKMTTAGLLLVGATALISTLVVGYRGSQQEEGQRPWPAPHASPPAYRLSVPSQSDVEACNAYARQRAEAGAASGSGYETAYRACMHRKGH